MYHVWHEEKRVAPRPGEPCRPVKHCTPIDLYWTYLGPSTKPGYAVIATVGGRRYMVPRDTLTTSAPFDGDCQEVAHQTMYKSMHEIYVRRSRPASNVPGGKKRRETKLERDARLTRWEEVLA